MSDQLYTQILTLVNTSLGELSQSALSLVDKACDTFLQAPKLRKRNRLIVGRCHLSLGCDPTQPIFYMVGNIIGTKEKWLNELKCGITTPRIAVRVLARIDAFTRWCVAREAGILRAKQNLRDSQKPWITKLESRLGIMDLAPETFTAKGDLLYIAMNAWPGHLKDLIGRGMRYEFVHMAARDFKLSHEKGLALYDSIRDLWSRHNVFDMPQTYMHTVSRLGKGIPKELL